MDQKNYQTSLGNKTILNVCVETQSILAIGAQWKCFVNKGQIFQSKAKWNCNYYLVILFEFEVSTVPHPRDSKSHGFGYFCFRLALMAASAFFSADSETYEN